MTAATTTRRRLASRDGGMVVVRSDRFGASARVHARAVWVTFVVSLAAAGVCAWSLTLGDFPLAFTDVLRSLVGRGSPDADFIVRTLRLPRGLTGLLVGAFFGLSGAVFQRVAHNPLATPDIIGVNAGAAVAAVFAIVVAGASGATVTVAALAGGAAAAVAIYVLAFNDGITGYRLVLIGIGMTAMLTAVTWYLLTRGEILDAQRAMVWLTGSLNARGWEHVRPLVVAGAVLVPAVVALARHLRLLELGDDTARALGVRVETGRAALVFVGVALAAAATASAGPVAFVALVAPQIARRLVGGRSLALLPAAACGALLLVGADLLARRVVAPAQLPVGVVTAIVGAPYLLYLLARANRIGSGG